jgi:hypothetical protein
MQTAYPKLNEIETQAQVQERDSSLGEALFSVRPPIRVSKSWDGFFRGGFELFAKVRRPSHFFITMPPYAR